MRYKGGLKDDSESKACEVGKTRGRTAADDVVRHGLEATLHVVQKTLNNDSKVLLSLAILERHCESWELR